VLDMTRTDKDARMLPPRIVDPSRIDVVVAPDVDLARLQAAVASLIALARASARTPIRKMGDDRRVVLGRTCAGAFLDAIRFPYGARDLAFCAFFQERASFAWKHEGRAWVMSVATSSTIGIPSRPRAPRAVRNIIDTIECVLGVATGRMPGGSTRGEAADRIRTTAMLAAIGCCQSGDEHASMNFADERVMGAGRPSHIVHSTLTLSAQGAALIPQLPSTIAISMRDLDDDASFVDLHSPMISAHMPDDPMERLRIMAEAEGLPILYRWLRP